MISSSFEKKYKLERKEYEQKSRDMQSDICLNFKFIKVYGIKKEILKDFSNTFSAYYEKTIKRVIRCNSIVELANNLSNILCQVAILLLGTVLVSSGSIKSGAIAAMMVYFSKVQDMYKDICEIVKNCKLFPQCLDRVVEFYLLEEVSGINTLKNFSVLEAEGIGYKFYDSNKVFEHISFTFKEGEKVAIVGPNGSGKSTLLKVISSLYDGYEGSIKINGTKLENFDLNDFFLITLHPTTLEHYTAENQCKVLLEALEYYPNHQVIFTKTNADTDGRIINEILNDYVKRNPDRARLYDSLGQVRYLSAIKHCEMVIGNSSSGLLEAPFLRKPTINIGIRQRGRLKAESVIDCEFEMKSIIASIKLAQTSDFYEKIHRMSMVYGEGYTSQEILNILKEIDLKNIIIKKFYDLI